MKAPTPTLIDIEVLRGLNQWDRFAATVTIAASLFWAFLDTDSDDEADTDARRDIVQSFDELGWRVAGDSAHLDWQLSFRCTECGEWGHGDRDPLYGGVLAHPAATVLLRIQSACFLADTVLGREVLEDTLQLIELVSEDPDVVELLTNHTDDIVSDYAGAFLEAVQQA
jgi:hypothetical protein